MPAQDLEQILKDYWQISEFQFIGKYLPHLNGKTASFVELRSMSGDLLYFPDKKVTGLEVDGKGFAFMFANEKILPDEYYQFKVQLNTKEEKLSIYPLFVPPQPFGLVSNMVKERIKKEDFIVDIFRRNGATPSDAKNLARSLQVFEVEMYTEAERFIFELLQNADDFPDESQGNSVSVDFIVLNENILIQHNGRVFDERDVKSICSIADSSKAQNEKTTGYKGIGFKSVFTNSQRVYIASGGYEFCFNREQGTYSYFDKMYKNDSDKYTQTEKLEYIGAENVPWQIKPIWRERYLFPREVKYRKDFFASNVSFCLEYGRLNIQSFKSKAYRFFEESRFLLFLRNINRINYSSENINIRIERKIEGELTTLLAENKSKQYLIYEVPAIDLSSHSNELANVKDIPKKLIESPYVNITFAASIYENEIITETDSVLFTYLPTKDTTYNFPFLVNADFVTNSSREQIQSNNRWNELVFEHIGYQSLVWVANLIETHLNLANTAYTLIPEKLKSDSLVSNAFNKGFDKAIKNVAFVLTKSNGLQLLDDISIDKTGLSELLDCDFEEITEIHKYPASPNVQLSILISLCTQYEIGEIFDKSDLEDLLDSKKLDQWLIGLENNARFLQLLDKKGWLDTFTSKSIFLNQNNSLCSAEEIYDSFGEDWALLNWLELSHLNPEVSRLTSELALPIRKYEVQSFVKEEILENNSKVDELLDAKANSLNFYRYFFKHQAKLANEVFSDNNLRYFKVWGANDEYISDFKQNTYQFDTKLNELTDAEAFPEGQFHLLSPDYCEVDEDKPRWEEFWHRLGVKKYQAATAADLLETEVISQVAKLEKHFDDYDCPDEGGVPTETLLHKQNANLVLWRFIEEAIKQLPPEPSKEIRKGLGRLVVFTTGPCAIRCLQDCYLSESYTGNRNLEDLAARFSDIDNYFVSECYHQGDPSVRWAKLFKACEVKVDERDFAERLTNELASVTDESLLSATQFLFRNQNLIAENDERLRSLRILTSDGFVEAKDVVIGTYYTHDSLLDDILPSVELINLISEKYADKDLPKWIVFFQKLGVVVLSTEEEVIEYKIKYLLKRQEEVHTAENTFAIVSELVTLHQENKLPDGLVVQLGALSLLVKGEGCNFRKVNDCHLATEYNPKLNLENLLSDDEKVNMNFVSEKYLSAKESIGALRKFMLAIGVSGDFGIIKLMSVQRNILNEDYKSFIDSNHSKILINANNWSNQHKIQPWISLKYSWYLSNPKVSIAFFEKILREDIDFDSISKPVSYHFFYGPVSISNYVDFLLKNRQVIPTIRGHCAKAAELYSINFKDVVEDRSLLPAIDLSKCEVENQSLEAWLGIKQELSLALCLDCIRWKQDFDFLERKGIWRRIKAIIDLNGAERPDSEAKAALITFKENGLLPNQLNEWKPIEKLYFIENFEIGIGNSPWLVNKEIEFLAEAMGLKKLVESDFNPDFIGKNTESNFTSTLRDRMKYIAFAENQNDWVEREKGYSNRLGAYQFYRTSKIAFSYSEVVPPIQKTDLKFHPQENNVYFVGEWRGARAAELFDFVRKKLGLEKVTSGSLMDLLLNTESEILESFKDKQLPVPIEWKAFEQPATPPATPQPPTTEARPIETEPEMPVFERKVAEDKAITIVLTPEQQKKANDEAKRIAKDWLKGKRYDCSNIEEEYDQLRGVHHTADGRTFTVFVSSVKGGFLYLWPQKWLSLNDPDTFLLVVDEKGEVSYYESGQRLLEESKYKRLLMRISNSVLTSKMVDTIAMAGTEIETMQFIFYDAVAKFDAEFDALASFEPSNNPEIETNGQQFDDSFD